MRDLGGEKKLVFCFFVFFLSTQVEGANARS